MIDRRGGNVEIGGDYVVFTVYVKPRSRETKLAVEHGEIVFYTGEPALNGRANASLIKYLSKQLRVPRRNIEAIYGFKNRVKKKDQGIRC